MSKRPAGRPAGPETADEFELVLARTAALRRAGHTQTSLAREWGVRQPYLSRLMNGHTRSPEKYEPLFAEAVGVPLKQLWPHPPPGRRAAGPTPAARPTRDGSGRSRGSRAAGRRRDAGGSP